MFMFVPCRAARVAAAYSSSEEDENRVVKSKKDSRFDELRSIVQRMRNHEKIDDWASVAKDFDDITKVYCHATFLKCWRVADGQLHTQL